MILALTLDSQICLASLAEAFRYPDSKLIHRFRVTLAMMPDSEILVASLKEALCYINST